MTAQPVSDGVLLTAHTDDDVRRIVAAIPRGDLGTLAIKLDGTDRIAAAFGRAAAIDVRRAALSAVAELIGNRGHVFLGITANGVVVFDATRVDPQTFLTDIATRLSSTITDDGVDYFIENNIGVALPGDGVDDDPISLLQAAIGAVHASVCAGTRIAYAADVSVAELRAEVILAAELANSLGEAFTLHYQPIVDLETLEVVGYESLLRWTVDGRVRLPGEFLEAAEETSLIVPIGRWGVTEAIAQIAQWRRSDTAEELFMSVNFSSQQLCDRDLTAHIRDGLESMGVPAAALWVEVTERDLVAADSPAAQTIRELDELGCVVCVDDLGTGYSALRYMVDHPISVAKIDRSLVEGIDHDLTTRRIVETVCRLSESLDISTVAEGVERDDQVPLLRDLGFTHGQGFLFGKPLAAHDISVGTRSAT